jgi:hypothetical protein
MKKIYALFIFLFCLSLNVVMNAQPCSGTPGGNTIVATSDTVCVGDSVGLSLANSYPGITGLAYQWQVSNISQVGPWTSIPGATLNTYTSGSLTMFTWYNIIITCTISSQATQAMQFIMVANCQYTCTGTPAPTTIVPPSDTVCTGGVANLALSTTYTDSGIMYQWGQSSSSSGPFTAITGATLNSYNSPPLTANNYYEVQVSCIYWGGTVSATSTISVISCSNCSGAPGPNSIAPTNQTVCPGSAASMSLATNYGASGLSYQWQSSTTSSVGPYSSIPGATLSSYTSGSLNNTTWYRLVVTCTNSSQSTNIGHVVSVVNCSNNCVANANFTLVPTSTTQVWNAIPASSSSMAAAEWSWGDGSTSSTLFTSHQYSAAGLYNICLSVTLTCNATASSCASYSVYRSVGGIITVNVIDPSTVGLNENPRSVESLRVFPNPNNGHFSLQFSGNRGAVTVEVINIVGQVVYRSDEEIKETLNKSFDLTHMQEGIYFVKVAQAGHAVSARISVQR